MTKSESRLTMMVAAAVAIELKGRALFSAKVDVDGVKISHSTKCGQGKVAVSWHWGADIEARVRDYIETL